MLPRVDVRRCPKIFHKRRCCWKTVQVSCGIHTFNRKACFFTCNLPVNCGIQQKHMCLLRHFAVVVHIFFSINHIHVFSPTNQQSLGPKSNDQNPGPMFLHRKKTRLALVEYASSHCWRGPRCSNVVSKGSHWEDLQLVTLLVAAAAAALTQERLRHWEKQQGLKGWKILQWRIVHESS